MDFARHFSDEVLLQCFQATDRFELDRPANPDLRNIKSKT